MDTISWNSSNYIHLLTEAQRRAYADRAEHMGDPDFWDNPIAMLTSKEYAKERLDLISMEKATPSLEIAHGTWNNKESVETTHYSVMDKAGNVAGITTTINLSYGNKKVVDGALRNYAKDLRKVQYRVVKDWMSKAKSGVIDFFDLVRGFQHGDSRRAYPYEIDFLMSVLTKDKIIDRFRKYFGGKKGFEKRRKNQRGK